MSLFRKALPLLIALGTLGCAADEFAGPADQNDRSDEAGSETVVALSTLQSFQFHNSKCRIRYEQNELSVSPVGSETIVAAELEWSHPGATVEYLADGSLAEALNATESCPGADFEQMILQTDGASVSKDTAGCDGAIGNIRIHMESLAAAYFPNINCGS